MKNRQKKLRMNSEELVANIHSWAPKTGPYQSKKPNGNTSLRIGAIVGDRLYHGLKYDCEIVVLTPDNWQNSLKYLVLDVLLIDSCIMSVTGHWYLANSVNIQEKNILYDLIKLAKDKEIPSIFWNTQDSLYHEHYCEIARNFDHVFCADPRDTLLCRDDNISATTLLPAAQPALYNPFTSSEDKSRIRIGVLYDGWADILRYRELLEFINVLGKYDLKIVDSKNSILKDKLRDVESIKEMLIGCVSWKSRLALLKRTNLAFMTTTSLLSKTSQSWDALEIMACRVPLVHVGSINSKDIRKGLVHELEDKQQLDKASRNLYRNREYREEAAQVAWREIHSNHTYLHRLRKICDVLDINHEWEEFPPVTLITPTNRPQLIERVLSNYDGQNYPNKELLIINNDDKTIDKTIDESIYSEIVSREDVQVINQHKEKYAGSCLNIGAYISSGLYCFRFDDDDYYSRHYIEDMLFHLKSVDADIFGKPPSYMYFEEDCELYAREGSTPQLSKLSNEDVKSGKVRLGGNSISGKTEVLRENGYVENIFGSADTAFLLEAANKGLNIFSFDKTGLIASRRSDVTGHTWQRDKRTILRKSHEIIQLGFDELLHNEIDINKFSKKKNVLFIGPGSFRENVWQNRAKYIFPDLLEAIHRQCNIFMLTGKMPEFANEQASILRKNYGVNFTSIVRDNTKDRQSNWIDCALDLGDRVDFDVVTNFFGSVQFPYIASQVAKKLGCKSVVRVAGNEIETRIILGNYRRNSIEHKNDLEMEAEAFCEADKIIAMSELERKRISEITGNLEKVSVCIRGIDLEKYKPTIKSSSNYQALRYLFIGRKSREKGYDIVEDAAKRIEKCNEEFRFLFAGDFEKCVDGNRMYLGFIPTERLSELYDDVDAVFVCGRSEGMPQILMEAMAKGKPCIVTKHIFQNIFEDKKEVIFVDKESSDLINKITYLYDNPEKAYEIGSNARRYAEKYFDNKIWREKYHAHFFDA